MRELREELDIEVAEADLKPLTFASHRYESFHLIMPLFGARPPALKPDAYGPHPNCMCLARSRC